MTGVLRRIRLAPTADCGKNLRLARERPRHFFDRRMAARHRSWFLHHVTGWPRAGLLRDAFERARAAIPPEQWLDVRVEDVSADPRGQFATILKFLDLLWTPSSRRAARHRFDSDRREAFGRDLDPRALAMLEGSLRDLLETLGTGSAPPR